MYVYILAYHICNELATLPADGDLRGARMRYTSPQAMKSMNEVSWMAGNNPSLCRHEQDSSASPSQHMSRVAAARDAVRRLFFQLTTCVSAETVSLPLYEIHTDGLESEQLWAQTDIQIATLLAKAKRSFSHLRVWSDVPDEIFEQEGRFRAGKLPLPLAEFDCAATERNPDTGYVDHHDPSRHPKIAMKPSPCLLNGNFESRVEQFQENATHEITSTRQHRDNESPRATNRMEHVSVESAIKTSIYQKEQERLTKQIQQLEETAVCEKPWSLRGEAKAKDRPKNSTLSLEMDFDRTQQPPPDVNRITTAKLEELIKHRIADDNFDDVEQFEPVHGNQRQNPHLSALEDNRSSNGLADLYADEYLKVKQHARPANVEAADKNAAQKGDIHVLFRSLSSKLDALSSLQVTNKLHKEDTPLYFDGAALNIEDVTWRVISNVSQRAPEEVNGIQFGKSQSSRRAARQANGADGELTSARKKARRAREKRKHQLSGVDQERRRSEIRLLTEAKSAAAYRAGFPATQQDSLVSSHKSKSVYSQSSKMFSLLQDVR